MKLNNLIFLFIFLLISLTLFCSSFASPEEAQQQEASPSFTNRDLDQYRPPATADESPAQEASMASGDRKSDKRQLSEAIADKKEQEYWCKKARKIKKNMAIAQDVVNELTAQLNELSTTRAQTIEKRMASLEKQQGNTSGKLKAAGKRLRERQEILAELENNAHRSNIPPGWLRC